MGGGKMFVPHWKTQKINGIEELEMVQAHLKGMGLKDPWMRDEVWRYTCKDISFKRFVWHPRYLAVGLALSAAALYFKEKTDPAKNVPHFHLT